MLSDLRFSFAHYPSPISEPFPLDKPIAVGKGGALEFRFPILEPSDMDGLWKQFRLAFDSSTRKNGSQSSKKGGRGASPIVVAKGASQSSKSSSVSMVERLSELAIAIAPQDLSLFSIPTQHPTLEDTSSNSPICLTFTVTLTSLSPPDELEIPKELDDTLKFFMNNVVDVVKCREK